MSRQQNNNFQQDYQQQSRQSNVNFSYQNQSRQSQYPPSQQQFNAQQNRQAIEMRDFSAKDEKSPRKTNAYEANKLMSTIMGTTGLWLLTFLFWFLGSNGGALVDKPISTIDLQSTANRFDKIAMTMRIIPSYNTENNMIKMKYQNKTSPSDDEYDTSKLNDNDSYFYFDNTLNYFPTVHMNEKYVPIGNSKPYCVHTAWNQRSNQYQYDKYIDVKGQPTCVQSTNPKSRWQDEDPKNGVDIYVTRENDTWADSAEDCEEGSYYKQAIDTQQAVKNGKCFTYEVMTRLCLVIQFHEVPENATYSWEYIGGCYDNNQTALYKPAQADESYNFDNVPIEIRESKPFVPEGSLDDADDFSVLNLLGNIFMIAALLATGFLLYILYLECAHASELKKQGISQSQSKQVPYKNGNASSQAYRNDSRLDSRQAPYQRQEDFQ